MIQLVDLFCLLEHHKNRILQDYRLLESHTDLPSIQPFLYPSNAYVTENEPYNSPIERYYF